MNSTANRPDFETLGGGAETSPEVSPPARRSGGPPARFEVDLMLADAVWGSSQAFSWSGKIGAVMSWGGYAPLLPTHLHPHRRRPSLLPIRLGHLDEVIVPAPGSGFRLTRHQRACLFGVLDCPRPFPSSNSSDLRDSIVSVWIAHANVDFDVAHRLLDIRTHLSTVDPGLQPAIPVKGRIGAPILEGHPDAPLDEPSVPKLSVHLPALPAAKWVSSDPSGARCRPLLGEESQQVELFWPGPLDLLTYDQTVLKPVMGTGGLITKRLSQQYAS